MPKFVPLNYSTLKQIAMLTKSILKNVLFWVCALLMTVGVTSCSDDDNNIPTMIGYEASGTMGGSGSIEDTTAAITAPFDYTKAIHSVIGGDYVDHECDDVVIAACDAVFERHRAEYPNLKGEIEIRRYDATPNATGEATDVVVIKTYIYE